MENHSSAKPQGIKRIGVAIDSYKLERYTSELKKAGFNVVANNGPTRNMKILTIDIPIDVYERDKEVIVTLLKKLEHSRGNN